MRHGGDSPDTNDATCALFNCTSGLKEMLTVWSAPSAATTLARSIESIQVPGQLDVWIVFT